VVKLSEHPVEQVAQGRCVTIALFTAPLVVLFSRFGVRGGDEGPEVADGSEPVFLTLR
jgi:hypothetical protein